MGQKSIALIGSKGMLASMIKAMLPADYVLTGLDLPEFDLTDCRQVLTELKGLAPDIIINCAAFTQVDLCEGEKDLARRVNGDGPGYLAEAALGTGTLLVHISTDFIFDGNKRAPYIESDSPAPLSVYGESKRLGEEAIINSHLERYFILRTSWLYGPGGNNFVETMIRLGQEREELRVVTDQRGTPTYTADLVTAIFSLVELVTRHPSPVTGLYGTYHFSNLGACSWYEFANEIFSQFRQGGGELELKNCLPIASTDYPQAAKRPANSVLDKNKIVEVTDLSIPSWQKSLGTYLENRRNQ